MTFCEWEWMRKQFDSLLESMRNLEKEITKMATKEELEALATQLATGISDVSDKLTDFAGDFQAAITELQNQIAAGATDLGPAMATLNPLLEKITAISQGLASLDSTAESISGKPTPPPVA